jgi:hypothetical protein
MEVQYKYTKYLTVSDRYTNKKISLLSWEEKWIAHMFSELGQLIWCFFIGVIFCPLEASDIQRAFDGSI